jgi:hypothetical protein
MFFDMIIRGIHSTLHSSTNFLFPKFCFNPQSQAVCFSHGETTAAFSPKHLKNPKIRLPVASQLAQFTCLWIIPWNADERHPEQK